MPTVAKSQLRALTVARAVVQRILAAPSSTWFTIPQVACGVDSSLRSKVVPDPSRRMIRRMGEWGYLEVFGHTQKVKYRVPATYRPFLEGLLKRSRTTDYQLNVFMSLEETTPELLHIEAT